MRWIEFENKKPTEAVNDWPGWSEAEWQAWLNESKRLLDEITALNNSAEILWAEKKDQEAAQMVENAMIS